MIKGKNIDNSVLVFSNKTIFDLSATAANEFAFVHPKAIRINSVNVIWVEGSSAGDGISIIVGATSGGSDYATVTSAISQAAGTVNTYTGGELTLALVPAGGPVYIGHAGSKDGAGTCFVAVNYTVL